MLVYQRVFGIVHRTKPVGTWCAGDHAARELRKRVAGRLHRWGGLATACERVPTLGLGWIGKGWLNLLGKPSS